jgi:protoheme IX farnesyltransferase
LVQLMKNYFQLVKPRITILILLVALASFFLAGRGTPPDWKKFAVMMIGTALLASGIFALNAYLERDTDLLMRRTASRPLPAKRLLPGQALAFGVIATAAALFLLSARLGLIAGIVGLFTFVSYVLIYTPLKRHSGLHTAVGALSGATPPLIGWAAARGVLEPGAWILSGVLFLWQFPHFLAIESMYRDDYEKAGIRVLPVSEPTGTAAASVMVAAMCLLLPLSAAPFFAGLSSGFALVGCLVAGAGFLLAGVVHSLRKTAGSARIVLRTSLLYLPVVFALLVLAGPR